MCINSALVQMKIKTKNIYFKIVHFPGDAVDKNPPANSGEQLWSLVQGDSTCHRAPEAVSHNHWAHALEPTSHNYWACVPQLPTPACLELMLHSKGSPLNEKPMHGNKEQPVLTITRESPCKRSEGLAQPKNLKINKNLKKKIVHLSTQML